MVIAYKTKGKEHSTKKKKKEKETEEQATMRDYRDALLADMKAICKFCLCLNVASIQMETKMYKNTSIPNRTYLHFKGLSSPVRIKTTGKRLIANC